MEVGNIGRIVMQRQCQNCGGKASFKQPHQKGKRVHSGHKKRKGRDDHDLCARCWHNLMTSVRMAQQRENQHATEAS